MGGKDTHSFCFAAALYVCEADAKGRSVAKMEIQVRACMGNGKQGDEVLDLYSARTRLKQLHFKLRGGPSLLN